MPKFFTIMYAGFDSDDEFSERKRSPEMTDGAIKEALEKTEKIRQFISPERAVVVTSGVGASKQCADIVSRRLNSHQLKSRVLINPSSRGGPISQLLSELEKSAKKTGVFVIITSPDNHEYVETYISTRLKRGELVDVEYEEELNLGADFDIFDDDPSIERTFVN